MKTDGIFILSTSIKLKGVGEPPIFSSIITFFVRRKNNVFMLINNFVSELQDAERKFTRGKYW